MATPIAAPETTSPPSQETPSKTTILLRSPRKYSIAPPPTWTSPSLEWMQGTWAVTHSTLPMWRKARNVSITYTLLPPTADGVICLDDRVENKPTVKTFMPQPKTIEGIDTPDGDGAWAWRGKGWLRIASSKWEVLGWGERDGERWVVTWFAPSLFTPAGVDVYSSRREGISAGLLGEVQRALEGLEAKEVSELCKSEMREVEIKY